MTPDKEEQQAVLRLWDFGGQTEFYATHHMFLDAGAVNIIVMDISQPLTMHIKSQDEDLPVGIPNTQEEFLCYWLKSIEAKARQTKVQPEVNLILTHVDMIPHTQVARYVSVYQQEIQAVIQKHELLPVHHDQMFLIDNKNGSEEAFGQLRQQLKRLVMHQVSWGLERPITWLKLEADMKKFAKVLCWGRV